MDRSWKKSTQHTLEMVVWIYAFPGFITEWEWCICFLIPSNVKIQWRSFHLCPPVNTMLLWFFFPWEGVGHLLVTLITLSLQSHLINCTCWHKNTRPEGDHAFTYRTGVSNEWSFHKDTCASVFLHMEERPLKANRNCTNHYIHEQPWSQPKVVGGHWGECRHAQQDMQPDSHLVEAI